MAPLANGTRDSWAATSYSVAEWRQAGGLEGIVDAFLRRGVEHLQGNGAKPAGSRASSKAALPEPTHEHDDPAMH